jgi:hypothetical protein
VLGGLGKLAAAIGVKPSTLSNKSRPSPGLALAVSRVAGVSLDAMLAGKLRDAGRCRTCGQRPTDDNRGDPAGIGGAGVD